MLTSRQKFIKKIALPLALLVFLGLFVTDIFFVPPASSSTIKFFGPKDTSISKDFSPRIDEEAAAVVRENDRIRPLCFTPLGAQKALTGQAFPSELWLFLLAAYMFLMFFNLFYDFEHSNGIHPVRSPSSLEQDSRRPRRLTSNGVHWFWESGYTILALWSWFAFDGCRTNLWFPLYVIKLGVIVYLAYLYLYYKKKELQLFSDEDLENFER